MTRNWTQSDFDQALQEINRLSEYLQARMDEQAAFGRPGEFPRDNQSEAARSRLVDTIAVTEDHLPDLDEDPTIQAAQAEVDQVISNTLATGEAFASILANDPTPAAIDDAEEWMRNARRLLNELDKSAGKKQQKGGKMEYMDGGKVTGFK